jgi:hypothetical protein
MFQDKHKKRGLIISLLLIALFLIDIISGLLLLYPTAYCASDKMTEFENRILSLAKNHSPKLYEELENIERLPSNTAITICVDLTDYYLGEHGSEILMEKATKIGEKILPFLIERRNSRLNCLVKYKELCVTNIEERNRKIDWMIDAINKGIVLYAEYPKDLQLAAEDDIKIVKIFIEDYRKNVGALPQDLNVLREYVWRKYGYKLRIHNPWGYPLKYILQQGKNYLLLVGHQ